MTVHRRARARQPLAARRSPDAASRWRRPTASIDLRRARGAVRAEAAAARPGAPARLLEMRQRRRLRGPAPRRARRPATRWCCWPRTTATGTHEIAGSCYAGATDDLHPDLALLLSTSGSTGSPKLVRLSHDNLAANAAQHRRRTSGSRADDRAITSLPLHYCYGLSVLTSHLAAGASVVLTDLSVADECFWDLARDQRATSFAGRALHLRPARRAAASRTGDLPDLRYVTQAGGRMDPDAGPRATRSSARERGFDLFVMYGQTEATARMAYLPAGPGRRRGPTPSASRSPVALPARARSTARALKAGVGELVYTGPNVMMGYAARPRRPGARPRARPSCAPATSPGRPTTACGRCVGRLDRFAKVFGLRLDLAGSRRVSPGTGPAPAGGRRRPARVRRPARAAAAGPVPPGRGHRPAQPARCACTGSTALPHHARERPTSRRSRQAGRAWPRRRRCRAEGAVGSATALASATSTRSRSAVPTRRSTTASSTWVVTRSPSSRCPSGSGGGWATCRPDGSTSARSSWPRPHGRGLRGAVTHARRAVGAAARRGHHPGRGLPHRPVRSSWAVRTCCWRSPASAWRGSPCRSRVRSPGPAACSGRRPRRHPGRRCGSRSRDRSAATTT